MAKKFEVMYVHEAKNPSGEKPFTTWFRCGFAHQSDNGKITVRISTMPNKTDEEGNYKFILSEPMQKGGGDTGGGF